MKGLKKSKQVRVPGLPRLQPPNAAQAQRNLLRHIGVLDRVAPVKIPGEQLAKKGRKGENCRLDGREETNTKPGKENSRFDGREEKGDSK